MPQIASCSLRSSKTFWSSSAPAYISLTHRLLFPKFKPLYCLDIKPEVFALRMTDVTETFRPYFSCSWAAPAWEGFLLSLPGDKLSPSRWSLLLAGFWLEPILKLSRGAFNDSEASKTAGLRSSAVLQDGCRTTSVIK